VRAEQKGLGLFGPEGTKAKCTFVQPIPDQTKTDKLICCWVLSIKEEKQQVQVEQN